MRRNFAKLTAIIMALLMLVSCSKAQTISENVENEKTTISQSTTVTLDSVGEFDGSPYIEINNNKPQFDSYSYSESFEEYGELDSLGRCTTCFANIGKDLMPTEERGEIGSIKPTGWHTVKYDNVDGKYLYNRCHLIGYQLTAENANERNLITGTRYLNIEGMLPFEDKVADYIKDTGNHVLYRVTPIFKDDELVARGVQMEGYSLEDNGEGICFNVYCYNAQPDIQIDYATGDSEYIGAETTTSSVTDEEKHNYVVNINTKKFHTPECENAKEISEDNKKEYYGYRQSLIDNGYSPCGNCKP